MHDCGRPILLGRIHTELSLSLCNLVVHKYLGARCLTQDQETEIGATTPNLEYDRSGVALSA